jgi:purine-binding chemotaxis protein CheW
MGALVKAGRQLPGGRQQAPAEPQQYLTFVLGGEMFAIGILCVKEIIEYGSSPRCR